MVVEVALGVVLVACCVMFGLDQEMRTLRAGAVPRTHTRMVVSIADGLLIARRLGIQANVPLSEIIDASYVFPDLFAGAHWLDAVNTQGKQLLVPENSEGFEEVLNWLSANRELKRIAVE